MTTAEKLEALMQKAIDNGADLKLTPFAIPDYAKLCLKSPWQEQLLFGSHDFARALFGEYHEAEWLPHDVPIKRKDAKPEDFGAVDYQHVADEHWKCTNCGKKWGSIVNDMEHCELLREYVAGWQYHLQQAVIVKDSIGYMYRVVFGNDV